MAGQLLEALLQEGNPETEFDVNLNGHAFFNGVQHVPGMGFVQLGNAGAPARALGDDASVMMISGLGSGPGTATSAQMDTSAGSNSILTTFNLGGLLSATVDIGGIKVPVWLFLLAAAAGLGFAGWYLFFRKK